MFQKCVYLYPSIMGRLQQRHDFTDADISNLQKYIVEWYVNWISLTGTEDMAN